MQRLRPRLKNGVDLQLQSAFEEGNWPVVVRLAEKRFRTLNDPYYEVVKICAESQLDDATSKLAAVTEIEQFVKDGTVIKDIEALDLLEWVTEPFLHHDDYPETLGMLRVRAAKALSKDKASATRCLEQCLLHWDLNGAQQIAAMLDRSFPQDRSFMFWNIVITHMLSESRQSPPEKKRLYATLAQRQIERAAVSMEHHGPAKSPRTVQTEEEVLLLYEIVEAHGTKQDFENILNIPGLSPSAQFRSGRKELLQRALARYRRESDWPAIFNLCKDCLSIEDVNGQASVLASDYAVWKDFIEAASHLRAVDHEASTTVRLLLNKLKRATGARAIHRRNILMARLLAAFHLNTDDEDDMLENRPSSLRIRELAHYIDDQSLSPSCFDDIKGFVGRLDEAGMKHIAYDYVPGLKEEVADVLKSARLHLLSLKLQYFVLSCVSTQFAHPRRGSTHHCTICDARTRHSFCPQCTSRISSAALEAYTSISQGAAKDSPLFTEIMPELALLHAFCSIRFAFHPARLDAPLLRPTSLRYLLRALLILEHQTVLTPKHSGISLYVVQLNLLLGSAHRAREVWDPLDIKQTILDSLSPIFFDRLSTIAPSVASPSSSSHQLAKLSSHYSVSLKLRMPQQLIDAFEAGNYSSVLAIPKYTHNLRASCTRAMSLVEETRAERLFGLSTAKMTEDTRFSELSDDVEMNELADYGSFPCWEAAECSPAYARLRIGPQPSSRRLHLSLLSEAFHAVLAHKPAAAAAASRQTGNAASLDQVFLIERVTELGNSVSRFLSGPVTELTRGEDIYFNTLGILGVLLPLSASRDRTKAMSESLIQLASGVKTALDTLSSTIERSGGSDIERVVRRLGCLHDLTMLHDAATAANGVAKWILSQNEREKEGDRSSLSLLSKDFVAQVKTLQAVAEESLERGKAAVAGLRHELSKADFEKRLRSWILAEGDSPGGLRNVVEDGTIADLVRSWRLNVKGWQQVKWG